MNENEVESFLNEFGIPPDDALLIDDEPPEPVDVERLRAFYRDELSPAEEEHVAYLITHYRAWYEADWKLISEGEELEATRIVYADKRAKWLRSEGLFSRVPRRWVWAIAGVAAILLLAMGVFLMRDGRGYVTLREPGGRIVIDGSGNLRWDLNDLSTEDQRLVRNAVVNEALDVGHLPRELQSTDRFMSGQYPYEFLVSPVETVVLSTTPLFRWNPVRSVERYQINIHIASTGERIDGATVADVEWRCSTTLERGATYSWKVTAFAGDEAYRMEGEGPRFMVATEELNAEVQSIQREYSNRSNLLLAQKYVDRHLFDLAESALMRFRDQNPDSAIAENLIENLQRERRSGAFRSGK